MIKSKSKSKRVARKVPAISTSGYAPLRKPVEEKHVLAKAPTPPTAE